MKEKIKIGVLLNSHILPSWEYHILQELKDSDYAEIVLIILNRKVHAVIETSTKQRSHNLLKLLERADRFVFNRIVNYDLKKDISGLVQNIPQFESVNLSDQELTQYDLDIILKFGSGSISSDILKKVKYGVLAYSLDNQKILNRINPGFWEVVQKVGVTNTSLMISELDAKKETVIFSSWESTCPFSISINRNKIHWRNALFMPRIIKGIYADGNYFLERQKNNFKDLIPDTEMKPQSASFSNDLHYVFSFLKVSLRTIYRKICYNDDFNWKLLIAINQNGAGYSMDFGNFSEISSPAGVFWADPFVVKENDFYYVFVEEYIYKKHKAHIAVLKLDERGTLLSFERIIERPYHMSYPFVFKLDNVFYMIPETSKNKTIELYKAADFPYKWEFDRNLMEDIPAVDTSIFFFNNKWWLFTSVDQTGGISGKSTELFLYFTDNIFSGNWQFHPGNPVVSDVRSARPAGRLYVEDGIIYRPSQDCSGRYGKAFNINKVSKLTETEYIETVHIKVDSAWDKKLAGTHTFNFDKGLTVIDVYSFRKRVEGL